MTRPLTVGTYLEYPPRDPGGAHRDAWEFTNQTSFEWNDVWIRIDDSASRFPPAPLMQEIRIFENGVKRRTIPVNARSTHIRFDVSSTPGAQFTIAGSESIRIEIDIDDGFEPGEYIAFTFSYRRGTDEYRVPGQMIEGLALSPRDRSSDFFASATETGKAIPGGSYLEPTTILSSITELYKQIDRINLTISEVRSYLDVGETSLDEIS